MGATRRRWSDGQKQFWPFTYSKDAKYRPFAMIIDSGEREYPGCHLRVCGFGHTLLIELPPIVRPWKQKSIANWDTATVARLGRDWYWDEHAREYGFQISDGGFVQVFFGRQTHDSSTAQLWCKHLPFTQWRHVRFSLYDLEGNHFWTRPKGASGLDDFRAQQEVEERCPSACFDFVDFDGERIAVRTHIEEHEWRFGESWFRWLSLFSKPKIRRSLDLRFSKETGKRKGSRKGGTLGHGIEMLLGETCEAAFRRYCTEHQMVFVGSTALPNVELSGPTQPGPPVHRPVEPDS
jgi:hypothetical protein